MRGGGFVAIMENVLTRNILVMGMTIVEMVQMNQTLADLLHVVQDSFNVTILTVFFQCIFVIEMMIVVTDPMKKVALNILAMENNSSAWKKMQTEQLSLHFVFLLTEGT